jgi:sterol desaturase/sphingolipid hydroxylase (fatty acid hydroxylase superfamily)
MKNIIIGWSIFFVSGAVFWLWEKRDSLRTIKYDTEFFKEIRLTVISIIFSIITAYTVYAFGLILKPWIPPSIIKSVAWTGVLPLPLEIRFVIAFFLKDFTYYVTHRATHANRILWRSHKMHHSSEQLWWLVSPRISLLGNFISSLGYVWFTLLEIPAEAVAFVGLFEYMFQGWLHLNVAWHPWMEVVEWIIITPRFHAVHHIPRPEIRGKNVGGMFSFFDRLFGTYVNPATIDPNKEEFGLNGEPITLRMIVGI